MSSQSIDPFSASCAGGVPAALALRRRQAQGLAETMRATRSRDEVMDTVLAPVGKRWLMAPADHHPTTDALASRPHSSTADSVIRSR